MLSEVTPEEFDDWMEMDQIIPIGMDKVCDVLAAGFAAVCNYIQSTSLAANGDMKAVEPKHFLYWKRNRKTKRKRQREFVSPNEAAMMFKTAVDNGSR